MTLPFPISPSQTDAKSPVDDNLMDSVREDLDYLDDAIVSSGNPNHVWNINGPMSNLYGGIGKRLDMQFLYNAFQFSKCRMAQRIGGSGTTEIDIRYHTRPNTPITEIRALYNATTTGVSRVAPALATQSISKATPQISTQSITRAKSALNVTSIINVGTNLWRYNLSAAPDSDYRVGYSVVFASCTSAGNNGTFVIQEVNQDGHPSVVISNASGVAQTSAAGNMELQLFSYNQTNPVNSYFEGNGIFASHTTGANNGTLPIHAINQGGNNIWVANASGATQGAAAGTCDSDKWSFNYAAPVSTTDFAVGEYAHFTGHSNAANNSDQPIIAINAGGNNLIIRHSAGVVQAGAAGQVDTFRWKYTSATNPAANVSIGDTVICSNHTSSDNDGVFVVKGVNRDTNDNIIVYNFDGAPQVGSSGVVVSAKRAVKFASDQSAIYTTDSYIDIDNCPDLNYNDVLATLPFQVLEVNRGGGSNYNVIISTTNGDDVLSPAGRVTIEAKSIFDVRPSMTTTTIGNEYVSPVFFSSANGDLKDPLVVPADTYLGLYILQAMSGSEDLSVHLT